MLYSYKPIEKSESEMKAEIKHLKKEFSDLPLKLKETGIPVIIMFEGWDKAGKGYLINELISQLDPRFLNVFITSEIEKSTRANYPYIYPFFNSIPEKGKIEFMDCGWMEMAVRDRVNKNDEKLFAKRIASANRMERQLVNDGYLIIKIFIDIDKDEQKKRIDNLIKSGEGEYCVTKDDIRQNREYDEFKKYFDEFIEETDNYAGWFVIKGSDKTELKYMAYKLLMRVIGEAVKNGRYNALPYEDTSVLTDPPLTLASADLTKTISDDKYKEELKKQQKRIKIAQEELHRLGIPMIIGFEGWDAAGKGGNIKRLTYPLDPRYFTTWPIASPEPHEKARHHLWRFWQRIPKKGRFAIFDRTWYGRVMVERIEGFCSENDWKRAYAEINEFEKELTDEGVIIIKFWIQIDNETQLKRFNERQNTPDKQWKITDEDWRNREKWSAYEVAVNEMLQKTSTKHAPWYIIESNDKKYGRIKTLTTVADIMEKAIEKRK